MGWLDDECVEGYLDGLSGDGPQPGANRSRAYRHGWRIGRGDKSHAPEMTAARAIEEWERIVSEETQL